MKKLLIIIAIIGALCWANSDTVSVSTDPQPYRLCEREGWLGSCEEEAVIDDASVGDAFFTTGPCEDGQILMFDGEKLTWVYDSAQ